MTPEEWLHAQGVEHTRHQAEAVERLLLDHFGSAERAQYITGLFPGRFLIQYGHRESFFDQIFGAPAQPAYKIIDKLTPPEPATVDVLPGKDA